MRAVICGASGAMGKLLCEALGQEVVGRVSIDGENGVARTFEELGDVRPQVVVDFSHHTAVKEVLSYAKGPAQPWSSAPPATRRRKSS